MGFLRGWLSAYGRLFFRNLLTVFGGTLTTICAVAIVVLTVLSAADFFDAAYMGIIIFMVLPGFFVVGLLMVLLGAFLGKNSALSTPDGHIRPVFVIDLTQAKTRRTVGVVAFLTLVNLTIVSMVSYKGLHYTESVEFCGKVCHEVMEPEYTAYLDSPHSEVRCAECHIGEGASWFVKSKLSGVHQVFAVLFNTHPRPIPTPVKNLRPSRETCEQCHWPQKFTGDRVVVRQRYEEDETNTRLSTVLLMHIGGGDAMQHGIHSWHIDSGKVTRYLPATEDQQEISLVRVTHTDGRVQNYATEAFEGDPAAIPDEDLELMDCVDCHNRPTHIYRLPHAALDDALTHQRIDATLPFIKKVGMEVLTAAEEAPDPAAHIAEGVRAFYAENHADVLQARAGDVDAAIADMQAIFKRNVFPKMGVTWGTYPNNLNHIDFPGCFRCHDDGHTTAEGDVISQDCASCHQVLAWDEENPEILETLGLN